jgi:uncharacterized damage-inducible protein DinB
MPNAPAGHADEKTMLLGWLDLYRDIMVFKIEGLSEEQARLRPAPAANSLLNLIVHLTGVEQRWFQQIIAGQTIDRYRDGEFEDLTIPVADAVTSYRAACERSNEIMQDVSLDEPCKGEAGYTPRWVLTHMLEETARHAGHADVTRELIDGAKGFSRDEYD